MLRLEMEERICRFASLYVYLWNDGREKGEKRREERKIDEQTLSPSLSLSLCFLCSEVDD